VGPRDGLQNEKNILSVADRAAWIRELAKSGVDEIEVGAFVSPKWVPQMVDSDKVFALVKDLQPQIKLTCLVPNEQGMQQAVAAGVKRVAIFTAASETFTQKNINCSIAESFARFVPVLKLAQKNSIEVRGYISTAFVCPYDGVISPEKTQIVLQRFLDLGVSEISIGDTIGKATPQSVAALMALLQPMVQNHKVDLAMHFHDTYGMAIANVAESLRWDVRHFDASAGGLGGCPYAKGASGNVATEDLLYFLQAMGYEAKPSIGWQIAQMVQATKPVFQHLQRQSLAKVFQLEV
ncbi:hydroxymethylglutaryl-CoA lyase, partial [Candidatus Parvarchaeota archaeon]|nr:hydroxymethylglutaryl-CoA lyase [Candidatus Parvarchaeota archaeon]